MGFFNDAHEAGARRPPLRENEDMRALRKQATEHGETVKGLLHLQVKLGGEQTLLKGALAGTPRWRVRHRRYLRSAIEAVTEQRERTELLRKAAACSADAARFDLRAGEYIQEYIDRFGFPPVEAPTVERESRVEA